SGRMGFALAEAARDRGATVTLVAGPASVETPAGLAIVPVATAVEMEQAMRGYAARAELVLMAAAVADYRPARAAAQKLKRGAGARTLELVPNPDILASLGARRYLERERAAGAGELLADGTGKAMASPRVFSSAAAARKENVVSSAKAPIEATGFSGTTAPVRPEPVSATSAIDLPATAKNLFGEDEPVAPSPKPAAAALMEATEPSIFEEGLNPAGVGPRTALAAESIPVLDQVAGEVRACTKCGLCDTRTKAVPGVGTPLAGIVFVGEAPGAGADRLGEPFVGRAGRLHDKIIKAMDEARLIPGVPLDRSTVFIANVLKCRPPE